MAAAAPSRLLCYAYIVVPSPFFLRHLKIHLAQLDLPFGLPSILFHSHRSFSLRQALHIFVQAHFLKDHPPLANLAASTAPQETTMLHVINRMMPDNTTQTPEPPPTSNASSSTITSLNFQQGSQWGPSGIGTVVFGCVASVLGILALWMMFWLGQREPAHAVRPGMPFALCPLLFAFCPFPFAPCF